MVDTNKEQQERQQKLWFLKITLKLKRIKLGIKKT